MKSYLVTYKKRRGRQEYLIELTSIERLLEWIRANGPGCSFVYIQVVEG